MVIIWSLCLPGYISCRCKLATCSIWHIFRTIKAVWVVVWCSLLVVGKRLWSITLVVGYARTIWTVYWNLQVVGSQSVTVCV